jgi:type II secretory pathway pseudopilin PulG
MRPGLGARQAGFTYIGLIVAIALIGLMLSVVGQVWSFVAQRQKEQQLLYVGDQYRAAIGSYFAYGSTYPLSLQDLLLDQRTPVPRRHLRQIYRDPLTNDTDWILIKDATGIGIMGVASRSTLVPIKRLRFDDAEVGFAKKDCYCDWKFVYSPPNLIDHRYVVPGQGQFGPNPSPTVTVPVGPPSTTPTPTPPSDPGSIPGFNPGFNPGSPRPPGTPYPIRPFRP